MDRSTFYQFQLVSHLLPLLGRKDLVTVVHALVTSELDYCNMFYKELPLKIVQKLKLVQDAAAGY